MPPEHDSAPQQPQTTSAAPAETTPPDSISTPPAAPTADEDSVYDESMGKTLGIQATDGTPDQPPPPSNPQQDEQTPPPSVLDDDQRQLLSRLKIPPEIVENMSQEQRAEFLSTQAKRESDQAREYERLKSQTGGEGGDVDGDTEANQQGQQAPPGGQTGPLMEQVKQTVAQLADIYGEQMNPLQDLFASVDSQMQQLKQRAASADAANQVSGQLALKFAIADLADSYPQVRDAETKQQVQKAFWDSWWDADGNPHPARKADDDIIDQVAAVVSHEAKRLFGDPNPNTAQVAGQVPGQQRLMQQPPVGSGKQGHPEPPTEDDIYEQSAREHLREGGGP